ncbi:cobalamin biosynthesis protein CobW [Marinomonas ushuaiensis DSM 15871]|uniref:Cobalamin biosynthesis protein CobW n=1 Tax=Marinomonas ushuaiensis DSM 15871 TaxID=1122207 RepID=X7E1U9_9GAMM|nr:GTP-binding protein [Marinomonas ushuaiensis]ETX10044.1 cobalamin biosynthesis protein CobW [Marinomonas ushuaiensis DSM 15871]
MSNKIPVTVLTGFLGSGKTTLLNRILSEEHGLRIAVIENEFGEIGIDQDLVINANEEIFEMNNGCICCTVRGDLIRILAELAERKDKFDRVILETTGMADPGPVAQTFFVDPSISELYELDGIITLVDAKHISAHLDDSTDEVMAQVAFADRIILNKADLVSKQDMLSLKKRLQDMNQMAGFYSATMADAPISELLDIGGFNLQRAMEMKPSFLEPEYPFEWGGIWQLPAGQYRFQLANGPDPDMAFLLSDVSQNTVASVLELAESVFVEFSKEGEAVSHQQTLVDIEKCYRLQLKGRNQYDFLLELTETTHIAVFSQHTPEEFEMLLLNQDDKVLTPIAEHFFNAEHEHNDAVTSVSIELSGRFDGDIINAWLSMFLQEKGADIYRMKGVFGIQDEEHRIVYQGVHMLLGAQFGEPWGDEIATNRMVFIGKNLDEDYIRFALEKCLYK